MSRQSRHYQRLRQEGWDIFKFQRPLFTTEEQPLCYIYNADRSIEMQVVLTPFLPLFANGSYKVLGWARPKGGFIEAHPTEPLIPIEEWPLW